VDAAVLAGLRRMLSLQIVSAAAAAATAAAAPQAQQLAQFLVTELSVEHLLASPGVVLQGIDMPHPRLSWRLRPTTTAAVATRGVAQSAYRLVLMSAEGQTLWDTQRQQSNHSVLIKCCGPTVVLASNMLYHWNVTAWDGQGVAAPTAHAAFRTGMFSRSDWHGKWITGGLERNLLRSPTVHVPSEVEEATVFVAGVGYFELTVNGHRAGAGRKYDVGWTDYASRVNYVAFDLQPFLRPGNNTLGAELGNGWYQDQGWYR
jgi:alpha-L-rhamnosidase